jgi:hypothetical protein
LRVASASMRERQSPPGLGCAAAIGRTPYDAK